MPPTTSLLRLNRAHLRYSAAPGLSLRRMASLPLEPGSFLEALLAQGLNCQPATPPKLHEASYATSTVSLGTTRSNATLYHKPGWFVNVLRLGRTLSYLGLGIDPCQIFRVATDNRQGNYLGDIIRMDSLNQIGDLFHQ